MTLVSGENGQLSREVLQCSIKAEPLPYPAPAKCPSSHAQYSPGPYPAPLCHALNCSPTVTSKLSSLFALPPRLWKTFGCTPWCMSSGVHISCNTSLLSMNSTWNLLLTKRIWHSEGMFYLWPHYITKTLLANRLAQETPGWLDEVSSHNRKLDMARTVGGFKERRHSPGSHWLVSRNGLSNL